MKTRLTAVHSLLDTMYSQTAVSVCIMKRIPAATLLHKITDPYIYGIKRDGEPQAYARIDTLEARLNRRNYGYRWNNIDFLDHCAGKETLYYYSKFQCHH